MKKYIIEIPDFDWAFNFNWEKNSKIETSIDENEKIFTIKWNKEWLTSLANHLLNLSQDSIQNNYHIHLDQYNSLENDSIELIIEKDNNI
jgi:hypothetical protein